MNKNPEKYKEPEKLTPAEKLEISKELGKIAVVLVLIGLWVDSIITTNDTYVRSTPQTPTQKEEICSTGGDLVGGMMMGQFNKDFGYAVAAGTLKSPLNNPNCKPEK